MTKFLNFVIGTFTSALTIFLLNFLIDYLIPFRPYYERYLFRPSILVVLIGTFLSLVISYFLIKKTKVFEANHKYLLGGNLLPLTYLIFQRLFGIFYLGFIFG